MQINTQNMFWTNTTRSQNTFIHLLPDSARTANMHKLSNQKVIHEKVRALTENSTAQNANIEIEKTTLSSFIVSKNDIPAKAAQKIEAYYQATGSLTDSITYKEARLKYLYSEYEKTSENNSEKHAEKMLELIDSEYKGTADVLNYSANLLRQELCNAETLYGKEFSEEYHKLLGDIPDKISEIADSLQSADNAEDALNRLVSAREQIGELAKELMDKYRTYTGKNLKEYSYKSENDYKESVKSYGLLWNWDEVSVDTENVQNLADYGVDIRNLSAIPTAQNLIDTKA